MEKGKAMILVTGATGFIGSHTWLELIKAGYEVLAVDNFENSSRDVMFKLTQFCHYQNPETKSDFRCVDLRNEEYLTSVMSQWPIDTVMHFAAHKSVPESESDPLKYYSDNINITKSLLSAMTKLNIQNLVYSSSASVYGKSKCELIDENDVLSPVSPYAFTKMACEQMIKDVQRSEYRRGNKFRYCNLRYFNPVGADSSGMIGEEPNGTPNNLMPYVADVALGKRKEVFVYGDDFETNDGTGIRDYVHVTDVAIAHIKAMEYLTEYISGTFNIGVGRDRKSVV